MSENNRKNESFRVSKRFFALKTLGCLSGGALLAAALPPWNWEWAAFVCLIPLIAVAVSESWKKAFYYGWVWGLGWSVFTYQFLREIEPPVPYLLAPVTALWPAVFAALLPGVWKYLAFPEETLCSGFEARKHYLNSTFPVWKQLLIPAVFAALCTAVSMTHARLFPWNGLEVTAWRNLALLQLCAWTGAYGITFVIAWVNAAAALMLLSPRRHVALPAVLAVLGCVLLAGSLRIARYQFPRPGEKGVDVWRAVLIQGDISQRRTPTVEEAREAMQIYAELTRRAKLEYPDISLFVWPESAIPVPYRSAGILGSEFRQYAASLLADGKTKLLIGALDYTLKPDERGEYGCTNSALLLGYGGEILQKYDKIHRVPFGEYVPFRKILPEWIVKRIDMNRDLTGGVNFQPMIPEGNIRVGTAICYEGIFRYIQREFALRGADLLLVLSNDAWYPRSSEPEQHLANAVSRAVETDLPMVRCGNNGGTLLVNPLGGVEHVLPVPGESLPELRRGRGYMKLELPVRKKHEGTFYLRHAYLFPGLVLLLAFSGLAAAAYRYWKFKKILFQANREDKS